MKPTLVRKKGPEQPGLMRDADHFDRVNDSLEHHIAELVGSGVKAESPEHDT
jgi:hypothetical protein